ncbi:LysR family transcriptional regulator [Klebsiella pneumoniae]|nr:LysR family transcriptional regulator [Klebsiella pneumoniae]
MNNALYNQIRIFQSIAREGNISAAARKLEITPPSVSNALRLLEEHIGHPLFVRTTRRIELTETGQQLLEQTAAAVETLRPPRRWRHWKSRWKSSATRIRSPPGQ